MTYLCQFEVANDTQHKHLKICLNKDRKKTKLIALMFSRTKTFQFPSHGSKFLFSQNSNQDIEKILENFPEI